MRLIATFFIVALAIMFQGIPGGAGKSIENRRPRYECTFMGCTGGGDKPVYSAGCKSEGAGCALADMWDTKGGCCRGSCEYIDYRDTRKGRTCRNY